MKKPQSLTMRALQMTKEKFNVTAVYPFARRITLEKNGRRVTCSFRDIGLNITKAIRAKELGEIELIGKWINEKTTVS